MSAKHYTYNNGDNSLHYYCDYVKECIHRNHFISETRKNLKKKELKSLIHQDLK
jgi:hypothetical protein